MAGTRYPIFVSITTIAKPERGSQLMNHSVDIETLHIECSSTGVFLLKRMNMLYRTKVGETTENVVIAVASTGFLDIFKW